MKHKLTLLLLVASIAGAVARADHVTAYDLIAQTNVCVDGGPPCTEFQVTGSYELNKQGQLVGPWHFQDYDGGIGGVGTTQNCYFGQRRSPLAISRG